MKPKALYFYTNDATFVRKDLRTMEKNFRVIKMRFDVSKKWRLPISFLLQFFFLIRHTHNASIILIQFGGYHSLLPVLFGRLFRVKSVIVLGGYDCVSFPEIGYGAFHNRLMKPFVSGSFKKCNLLLPVHSSLVYRPYTYFDAIHVAQGYKAFIQKLETESIVVYNGYNKDSWTPGSQAQIKTFITVAGGCEEKRRRLLKGVDMIIEMAKNMKDASFTIVGTRGWGEELPANVRLVDFTPNAELLNLYRSHRYYLQLSLSEGFPNALCESMLCGCIPIVSDVSSMPEIVGNSGYVLKRKDINELIQLTKRAESNFNENDSAKARHQIAGIYTELRREKELLEIFSRLQKSNL